LNGARIEEESRRNFLERSMSNRSSELYAFGPYRLDVSRRALTRENRPVALPPKAFDLLLLMVRSPGRAFSKQELMSSLWPGTFVEEANLSFQISTLRKALGEGGARWIETVPRHGYRFSGDVIVNPTPDLVAATPEPTSPGPAVATPIGKRLRWGLTLLFLLLIAALFIFVALPKQAPGRPSDSAPVIATPLTAYPGFEGEPSLSPDGSQVAFSWNGSKQENIDIYVKLVGPGDPLPLTTHPAVEENPAWSPTGGRIAFLRYSADRMADVFVTAALPGGAEKRVASVPADTPWRSRGVHSLAWTPDGKWLAVARLHSSAGPGGIWLLEVDGQQRRQLTTSPLQREGTFGDSGPAFSRDGRRLAFIRDTTLGSSAVYVLPLTPELTPAGPPVKVAGDPRFAILGLEWGPEDQGLVFSSGGHLGQSRLFYLPLTGTSGGTGAPVLLPYGEQATTITIRGGRQVYAANYRDTNLWMLNLADPEGGPEELRLASSTFDEHTPDFSPDGTRLAFASTRSGAEEIWIAHADGSNPRQMTFMGGPLCANPQWSPSGEEILFNSRRGGSSDLYVLRPASGEVRRLTADDEHEEGEARWSRDGRSIYFGSNRTGRFEVWKMAADGRTAPIQVTRGGGMAASESPDRRFLYYAKSPVSPTVIWRVPASGGEETLVAEGLSYSLNFTLGQRGLYLVALGEEPNRSSIDFVEYSTGRRTTLAVVAKRYWYGMALSRDQRRLLFPIIENDGSNLMLVEASQ
jgi:Tol biopolymer transport system component/DNA-binding winged helix-turn-helix (wHTH) protein